MQKGEYGYLRYKRKTETIKSIVFFAIAMAIFVIGYISTGTKKNWFTVLAVVSMLPVAKQITVTILYYKYKSGTKEVFDRMKAHEKSALCLSDIVITAYDKTFELMHVAIVGNTVIGYSEKKKTSEKDGEVYLKNIIEQNGYQGVSVKIYKKEKDYIDRLVQMQEHLSKDKDANREKAEKSHRLEGNIAQVIKAVSI